LTIALPWMRPEGDRVTVKLLINKTADGVRRRCGEHQRRIWYPGDFRKRVWLPAFEAAGLEHVKQWDGMHALRHFYASTMLEQGVSIKELSEYLGHTDPGFTLRIYTHLMPSSFERARLASDKVFKPRAVPDAA
jgi:integrase